MKVMVVVEEEVVVVVKSWNRVALYNALQRHVVPCHPPSSQLDMSHVALLHHVHGGSAAGGECSHFGRGLTEVSSRVVTVNVRLSTRVIAVLRSVGAELAA